MRNRSLLGALLIIGVLLPITSCTSSPSLTSIVVTPNVVNFGGQGVTSQLTAMGSYTHPGHPPITKDLTDQVTWATSADQCVTVTKTGFITSGGNICSNILVTASMPGFNGLISGTMTVNVTQPSSGGGGGGTTIPDVTSISIIPASATVSTINATTQFIAIGTLAGGLGTVDLTDLAVWRSSEVSVATINTTGLATALNAGTTTISAVFTNQDGTSASGTASLTVSPSKAIEPLVSIAVIPGSQTLLAVGQTAQFIAIGTTGTGTTVDLTTKVTWSSSITSVATINAFGLATATGAGTTAINAIATNPDGSVVTSSASLTVNITAGAGAEPLISLAIIPTSQSVAAIGETSQYIAIGTFSATAAQTKSFCNSTGLLQDCTSYVSWQSSDVAVGTISKNGLATAVSTSGVPETTAITAIGTNPDGTLVTGAASFTAGVVTINPLQSTLGVVLIGTGAGNGLVTAPSPQNPGGPNVISCTTVQGASCSQPFTTGSTVTLTATPSGGSQFGGWSTNCTPTAAINPSGANSCIITMTTNETVAAIFY
jgi:hypothetical protein